MNSIVDYLIEKYGYDEPIFTSDLKKELNMNPNTFRQTIKRMADKGLISKVEKGIYFIPSKNSILKRPILSVDKIVKKKYLNNQEDIIGYKTGTNFANSLGLTTQTASIPTIITNNTASPKREVRFYNKKVIVKKPKVKINNTNYKLFQVLDLLNDFEKISEQPIEEAKYKIINYLKDIPLDENQLKKYLNSNPIATKIKLYESGLYSELTQK